MILGQMFCWMPSVCIEWWKRFISIEQFSLNFVLFLHNFGDIINIATFSSCSVKLFQIHRFTAFMNSLFLLWVFNLHTVHNLQRILTLASWNDVGRWAHGRTLDLEQCVPQNNRTFGRSSEMYSVAVLK